MMRIYFLIIIFLFEPGIFKIKEIKGDGPFLVQVVNPYTCISCNIPTRNFFEMTKKSGIPEKNQILILPEVREIERKLHLEAVKANENVQVIYNDKYITRACSLFNNTDFRYGFFFILDKKGKILEAAQMDPGNFPLVLKYFNSK